MKHLYRKIKQLLNTPFTLLETYKNRTLFLLGMVIFSTLFIFLFVPFNISEWIVYTSPFKKLQLPGLVLICGLIITLSQLIQMKLFNGKNMKVHHLFAGFIFDALFATIPLSILYSIPVNSFFVEFVQTLKLVISLLALWYLIGLTLLTLIKTQQEKKEMQSSISIKKPSLNGERVNIKDENGQLRLSLKPEDLLFFESADNYVIVYFRKEPRMGREMVRTSLKNIEAELSEYNCIRCHRSYIVNIQNISSIKKNGRAYEITIQNTDITIPISRSYMKIIKDMPNNKSQQTTI